MKYLSRATLRYGCFLFPTGIDNGLEGAYKHSLHGTSAVLEGSENVTENAPPYRNELILGAMRNQKLTVDAVAKTAGVAPKSVVAIRGGDPNVQLLTLKKVVEAVGLKMEEIFREERAAA